MPSRPRSGSSEPVWGKLLPFALLFEPEFVLASAPEVLLEDALLS
jgi:hypothetical protein